MQADLDDRSRAPHPAAGQRELPVLFHLIDISRPRPAPRQRDADIRVCQNAPLLAPAEGTRVAHGPFIAVREPSPITTPLSHVPLAETMPLSLTDAKQPHSPSSLLTSLPAIQPAGLAPRQPEFISPEVATVPAATAAGQPQPPPENKVTLRTSSRPERRFKTPLTEDWFTAHGKFIALAFVVALIGTVYFARTTRRQVSTQTLAVQPVSPLADHDEKGANGEPGPQLDLETASAKAPPALVASAPDEASTTASSRVELHLPTVPQVATAPAVNKPATSDSLFVFPAGKKAGERVAARPDVPAVSANPPAAAPSQDAAAVVAMSPNYPVTSSPAYRPTTLSAWLMSPNYPVTSSPPLDAGTPTAAPNSPQTAAAPLAGPATPPAPAFTMPGPSPSAPPGWPAPPPQSSSQYPAPVGPQSQAWSPPPAGVGLPSPYQPQDNTARGPRYERTGSGNY